MKGMLKFNIDCSSLATTKFVLKFFIIIILIPYKCFNYFIFKENKSEAQ